MRLLKQSATRNVMVFLTDSADHVAGKAGLTPTISASKDGGAFAAITPTVADRGSGWYNLALTAAHTDTLGDLVLHVTAAGADPTDVAMRIVAVDYTDPVRFGLSALPNAAAAAAGGLPTIGAAPLSNLDATVSSRSTYAGGDTAGTTTLLGRLTAGRATNLDNLDAAVSTRSTYAGADTAGTATLLTLLTPGRATGLDNLDAAVSSRLAAADYAAPPTAAAIDAALSTAHGAGAWDATGGGGITITDVQTALTNQGYTAGRAPNLDNADVATSTRSTYAGGPVTLAAAGMDAVIVEAGVNARQSLSVILAGVSGVLSGAATPTVTVQNPAGTATRSTVAVDGAGNRTSVTLSPPA